MEQGQGLEVTTDAPPRAKDEISDKELIITVAQVAGALGYPMDNQRRKTSVQRARRWLKRTEAVKKRGNRWITTRHLLRTAFPEVWEEVAMTAINADADADADAE